jgi:hypothetical protein
MSVNFWVLSPEDHQWEDVVKARGVLKGSHKLCRQFINCKHSKILVANVDAEIDLKNARARHKRILDSILASISSPQLQTNPDMAVAVLGQGAVRLADCCVAGKDCHLRDHWATSSLIEQIEAIPKTGCNNVRLACIIRVLCISAISCLFACGSNRLRHFHGLEKTLVQVFVPLFGILDGAKHDMSMQDAQILPQLLVCSTHCDCIGCAAPRSGRH